MGLVSPTAWVQRLGLCQAVSYNSAHLPRSLRHHKGSMTAAYPRDLLSLAKLQSLLITQYKHMLVRQHVHPTGCNIVSIFGPYDYITTPIDTKLGSQFEVQHQKDRWIPLFDTPFIPQNHKDLQGQESFSQGTENLSKDDWDEERGVRPPAWLELVCGRSNRLAAFLCSPANSSSTSLGPPLSPT